MRATVVTITLVSLCSACSGKDSLDSLVCTGEFVPGVVVEVRDSLSGAPLAQGARGVVREGAFTDSLRPRTVASLQAAGERPGNYTVTVVHSGYAEWVLPGVQVQHGVCHVRTAIVQALLQPAP